MALQPTVAQREQRPGNQRHLVLRRWGTWRLLAAGGAGIALSSAFPPCEWAAYAWIALVPMLFCLLSRRSPAFAVGYVFGCGHFISSFAWLREVFILAPFGLGAVCALYPACWAWLVQRLWHWLSLPAAEILQPVTESGPGAAAPRFGSRAQCLWLLGGAGSWCGLEWLRGWLLSGFPWNQLGLSQWQQPQLLPISRLTGVYGLSFLLVSANLAVFLVVRRLWLRRCGKASPSVWAPVVLFIVILGVARLTAPEPQLGNPDSFLKVAVCQGNIPQIRKYTEGQLTLALGTYLSLTREVVAADDPQLVLWPETAVPAPMRLDAEVRDAVFELLAEIDRPLLAGSIDYRWPQDPDYDGPPKGYNSALFFHDGRLVDWYDKTHLVPFGEYVPLERHLPFLVEWIGMGRSLTPGTEFTVLPFAAARIGVNICFEDAFATVSRAFAVRGANLLITLTNDAWYRRTCGSRQHLAHSVLRAVETCRPMLRCGNNSDSCLILPDGRVIDPLYDPLTGDRFIRAAHTYTVPIWSQPPQTPYSRRGDWFAAGCLLLTVVAAAWCGGCHLRRKEQLYRRVTGEQ